MAKKTRSPEQQKYLDTLDAKLGELSSQGEEGKNVADNIYHLLQSNPEYITAKNGSSLEEHINDLKKMFDSGMLSYNCYYNEGTYDYNLDTRNFKDHLEFVYNMLGQENVELNQKEKDIIKELILHGPIEFAVKFLKQNFELFSQNEKEEIILSIVEKTRSYRYFHYWVGGRFGPEDKREHIDLPRIYGHYIGCPPVKLSEANKMEIRSRDSIFSPFIKETLENSHDDDFIFNVLISIIKYDYDISVIPENCKSIISDPNKLKIYFTPEFLAEKERIKRSVYRNNKVFTNNILAFYKKLGIKIPRNVVSEWDENSIRLDKDGVYYNNKFYNKYGGTDFWYGDLEKTVLDVVDIDEVKRDLNDVLRELPEDSALTEKDNRIFDRFLRYFEVNELLKLMDNEFKTLKFISKRTRSLKRLLCDGGLNTLFKKFGKIYKGEELQDSDKIDMEMCRGKEVSRRAYLRHRYTGNYCDYKLEKNDFNYINLETLNQRDFEKYDSVLCELFKENGLIGSDYLDNILKDLGYPALHLTYYMFKAKGNIPTEFLDKMINHGYYFENELETLIQDIYSNQNDELKKCLFNHMDKLPRYCSSKALAPLIQDIYASNDDELIKCLFNSIWFLSKDFSEEEVNILIRKTIKALSTQEDFEEFFKVMDDCAYKDKFGLFLKIKYLLTNKLDEREVKKINIPSDIYASLVISGIINISGKSLPKVGSSVFLEEDDLDKLSQHYGEMINSKEQEKNERQERLRKEKEENERIYNGAIENREKGEVVFEYEGEQKYILSIDRKNQVLKFITAPIKNFPYHANLHDEYIEDGRCLGGGRLTKDDKKKTIKLYGHSEAYGAVSSEEIGVIKKMLEKKFPDYKII